MLLWQPLQHGYIPQTEHNTKEWPVTANLDPTEIILYTNFYINTKTFLLLDQL